MRDIDSEQTRRTFLKVVSSTATVGALGIACGGPEGASEATGPVSAGNISSVAVGFLAAVGGAPVILGRDAGGLYAMTAICTHEQCDMTQNGTISPGAIACNCHGSRFSGVGSVTAGPASSPLKHYRVDLATDGAITVQAGTVVDPSVRTVVPT
jgi:Rieske Fe-S protein